MGRQRAIEIEENMATEATSAAPGLGNHSQPERASCGYRVAHHIACHRCPFGGCHGAIGETAVACGFGRAICGGLRPLSLERSFPAAHLGKGQAVPQHAVKPMLGAGRSGRGTGQEQHRASICGFRCFDDAGVATAPDRTRGAAQLRTAPKDVYHTVIKVCSRLPFQDSVD
jgi:hypothetical protein